MIKKVKWNEVTEQAKEKTDKNLLYAYRDCLDCINLNCVNQGYYYDEAGIYYREMRSRGLTITFEMEK